MIDFLKSRLIARVGGLSVVMLGALAAFIVYAQIHLDFWLALYGLFVLSCPIFAVTYRICKGGEEGGTDIEITDGQRKIAIGNIPLGNMSDILKRGISVYGRQQPLPRPIGIVKGNPADQQDLVELPSPEVAEETLGVPTDAVPIGSPNKRIRKINPKSVGSFFRSVSS